MTTVNVHTADQPVTEDPAAEQPEIEPFRSEPPEPLPSPFSSLKAKLAEVADGLYVDLEVPRWDVEPPHGRGMGVKVFARYRPLSPSHARRTSERFEKMGKADWETEANAQILVDACLGVYALLPNDDTKYSLREGDPTGHWTKIDHELAAMLGPALVKEQTATAVCRGLYCTDGDVTAAAITLADWSAKASEPAEKGFPRP